MDDRVRYWAHSLDLITDIWIADTDDWEAPVTVSVAQVQQNYNQIISRYGNTNKSQTLSPIVLTHELTNYTVGLWED